jgi:hypothetical protein
MPAKRKRITASGKRWTSERVHPAITRINMTLEGADDCLWLLLRGDAHHDNPKSDHDLQREHLDEAMRRNACIVDLGDLFCAMGGKADPRMMKGGSTRPEHAMANDYFDSLVRHNAEFLMPYAHHIAVLNQGNHETAVLKRQETCLNTRLVERINTKTGASVIAGGYGGWLHIMLEQFGTGTAIWVKMFHGSGGGGLMTFDTLRVRRIASFVPGADVVVSGHVHERWALEITQEEPRCDNRVYRVDHKSQWHVRTGCYKDEYADGRGGWHIERGGPPKPLGGYWMRVSMDVRKQEGRVTRRPRVELMPT